MSTPVARCRSWSLNGSNTRPHEDRLGAQEPRDSHALRHRHSTDVVACEAYVLVKRRSKVTAPWSTENDW